MCERDEADSNVHAKRNVSLFAFPSNAIVLMGFR